MDSMPLSVKKMTFILQGHYLDMFKTCVRIFVTNLLLILTVYEL